MASLLQILLKSKGTKPRLRIGFPNWPFVLFSTDQGLEDRPKFVAEREASKVIGSFMLLGWRGEIWFFCTTCTIEFLNAFIYECWRCIFMRYCHPSAEQHLKLFGKRVFNIREIILKLFLTSNFSSLSNRAYNLRYLQDRKKNTQH